MPVWFSQMFLFMFTVLPLMYVFEDKIEAFLDKIILKIKERFYEKV